MSIILFRNTFTRSGHIKKSYANKYVKELRSYCHFWGHYSAAGKVGSCPRSPVAVPRELNPYQQSRETKTFLHAQPTILATKQMPANMTKQNYWTRVKAKRCVLSTGEYIWVCHAMSCLIWGGRMGQLKNVKIFYKTLHQKNKDIKEIIEGKVKRSEEKYNTKKKIKKGSINACNFFPESKGKHEGLALEKMAVYVSFDFIKF